MMQKKMNDTLRLSGADYGTEYLEGRMDAAHVLKIRKGYTLKDLKHDCDQGAEQLRPLYRELAGRNGDLPTRAVFVADDEESGYLAIEAYASILLSSDSDSAAKVRDALYNAGIGEEADPDEDPSTFQEDANRIAVVDYSDVLNLENGDCSEDYWWKGLCGMVCLRYYDRMAFDAPDAHAADRFACCAMVFLLIIRKHDQGNGTEWIPDPVMTDEDVTSADSGKAKPLILAHDLLFGFALENAAPMIQVFTDADRMKTFYEKVFYSKARECGVTLSRDFDVSSMVETIQNIHFGLKSGIMKSAIECVQKLGPKGTILTTKDFDLFRNYRLFEGKTSDAPDGEDAFAVMRKRMVCQEQAERQLEDLVMSLVIDKKRRALGCSVGDAHNVLLFAGPSGTGKTTMAGYLAKALAERGLVRNSSFLAISGARLKGQFVGQTAHQVHEIFSRYSVIFIDEAYSLISKDSTDSGDIFAKEALAQLAIELENNSEGKCVIFAGYGAGSNTREKDNLMRTFISANPGIESRIAETICFSDYTPEEMVQIFHRIAKNDAWTIGGNADDHLRAYFALRRRDPTFGNGREARLVLEHAQMQAAARLSSIPRKELTKKAVSTLTAGDIDKAIRELSEGFAQQKCTTSQRSFGFIA